MSKTNEEKLAEAKAYLGTNYLLHESNKVKKLDPKNNPQIVDVGYTFRRVQQEMDKAKEFSKSKSKRLSISRIPNKGE